MARRKRVLEDSDSDSPVSDADNFDNDDQDTREERALFEDPYQRKRQKRNGKEDALYGIFAESDDEGPSTKASAAARKRKSDWAKAPAFVTGETMDLEKDADVDMDRSEPSEDDQDGSDDGVDSQEDSDPGVLSRSQSPTENIPASTENDELEQMMASGPRIGGIGSKPSGTSSFGGRGMSAAAFVNGGIGSSSFSSRTQASEDSGSSTPTAFGKSTAFSRASTSFMPAKPAPNLSASEQAHFSKISGSFGARMLSKMGWSAGTGLGTTGEGIVTPVESRLRPQKMGLAYRGFGEKTEQAKAEARRRGEVVSEDEDEKAKKGKGKSKTSQPRSDAWKKPKKTKLKVEHKTYEEIVAEAGEQPSAPPGIGVIIDATGATPREVSSISDVNLDPWAPSNDPTRIPEVRHNLRLMADMCKSDLDGLAKEGKELEAHKKYLASEDARLRKAVSDEAELIQRLQKVHLVVEAIQTKSKELSMSYECSLEPLSPLFCQLVDDFTPEFDKYRLDEIVVAAIIPIIRRMVNQWDPLGNPSYLTSTFRTWKSALKVDLPELSKSTQVNVYGGVSVLPAQNRGRDPFMTPFETLCWNVILPKIRSAINNEWSPQEPSPAVKLFECWSSIVPTFIRDNMLDQLILPKISKAVVDWSHRTSSVSLRSIVFPWLPYVGLRLDDYLSDSKRKIKSVLRSWTVADKIPADLAAWRSVFDTKEWDALMLKYVVPKLGATLRNDFRINPREQDMAPLHCVLSWTEFLRTSVIGQLLETAFFPKWLEVLHLWLIQPSANLEEVAQWYQFWKGTFPEQVRTIPVVSRGLTAGVQLMNTAVVLGPTGKSKLPPPDFANALRTPTTDIPASTTASRPAASRVHEITFKSIVEEFAASHNLLFIPTGRAHEKSRMPLYRVSQSVDGKGGLTVYVLDDAVWAPNAAEGADAMDYRAITLEDMVLRANSHR